MQREILRCAQNSNRANAAFAVEQVRCLDKSDIMWYIAIGLIKPVAFVGEGAR